MVKRVIILGSGFGGLSASRKLRKYGGEVLVLDKTNHHLFQPLLYQVASAALHPADIAVPTRQVLHHQKNTTVLMADIVQIDVEGKKCIASNGNTYDFSQLVVAVGNQQSYFGRADWKERTWGLKSIQDAVQLREQILLCFEKAERCTDPMEAAYYMRFVIVGGGPTGVELAGAIAEIARYTMVQNFRKIRPEHTEIYLVEGSRHLLSTFSVKSSDRARKDLEKLGVRVLSHSRVTDIVQEGVYIGDFHIPAATVIWAAGNRAPDLLKTLGSEQDRMGRVLVEPDLSLPGNSDIFVIGDAAACKGGDDQCLPGLASVAIQQGRYVGKLIAKETPPEERPPFKYFDKGMMATIGKRKAVVEVKGKRMSGFFAWLTWCFVHVFYLVNFRSRMMVLMEWLVLFVSNRRAARVIQRPIEEISPDDQEQSSS